MLGIGYVKVQPTTYLIEYKNGKIAREGAGLSFFYFRPSTSLVAVPVGSRDCPFIFEAPTADFQSVTVQGQVTYRIATPRSTVQILNYTLKADAKTYESDSASNHPPTASTAGVMFVKCFQIARAFQ